MLVDQCDGNMSEAARRSGLTTPLISRTLAGHGPLDPKAKTIDKVYTALKIKPSFMLKEGAAKYVVKDKYQRFADFIKTLSPERQAFFFDAAKMYGFDEGSENAKMA